MRRLTPAREWPTPTSHTTPRLPLLPLSPTFTCQSANQHTVGKISIPDCGITPPDADAEARGLQGNSMLCAVLLSGAAARHV